MIIMASKETITIDELKENSFPDKPERYNTPFVIRRSFIPTVPQDDQNGDLYNLGIDIYEQETLEREIIHQVDEALEKHKQKKTEVELLEKEKYGNLINGDTYKSSENKNTQSDNDLCRSIYFGNYEVGESETGRKVRKGKMTPFGTCMSFKSSEINCFGNVEKYLRDQIEAEKRSKELKKKVTASLEKVDNVKNKEKFVQNRFGLKRKIFFPKKRKRKPGLDSETSEEIVDQRKKPGKSLCERRALSESSCSEYFPSESEFFDEEERGKEEKVKKKKRKVARNRDFGDEDNWKTDDSDWEYSDDDEKKRKKKSKCVRREDDDGNLDDYLRRLSVWEKNNNQEQIETEVKILEGGLKVPLIIWNRLFNYQKVGVHWLWELHTQRCGGILGDEMGLGKTVQVIAFLSALSVSKFISKNGSFNGLGPVLIICPTTVMHQWVREFHQWWPQFRVALMHESGNYIGKKSKLIQEMAKSSKGILITSFASCIQQIDTLTRYLWHYVIIDEGHKIRNPDSQIANSVKQLRTPHRLILSGSPMQNNLKELWSLFDFIFPGKLGTLAVFMSEFAVPITQGGYTNATQVQVATAFKCATVLRDTISPYLLRRVKEDVKSHINLPMKNEQVLFCKLTEEQRSLYLQYLNSGEVESILCGRYKVFVGLINLRKICNHPHLYSGGPKIFKWDEVDSIPNEERFGYWKKAGKMIVVETLLKIWKRQDHRVLIFTQSRQMLYILESFVQSQGYEYLKLDGSTSIGSRQPMIHKFNQEKKYFIFLSTTHVGGLGVNLTGADRVIIYDPDWNPATDTQARERAWRIGQDKQVTIYRLVTSGTIEEKIYHRQIFKQFLTNKVLKDPEQRRFFKSNDLYELFTLKDTDSDVTETAALFAGMGSEVNLKRLSHRMKSKNKIHKYRKIASSVLTKEKIESMKKLAKLLSQQISNGTVALSKNIDCTNVDSSTANQQNSSEAVSSSGKSSLHNDEDNKIKKKGKTHRSKRKKERFATFEGRAVPHLMKKLEYKECVKLRNEYRKEQDDYILGKLFSKSGIKTALQHDRIMEEGPSDYALVEGEAEKVAKEAVRALKESRRQYFQSVENAAISAKPRFGARLKKKVFGGNSNRSLDEDDNDKKVMTSSELLSRIKERNRLLNDNLSDFTGDHSHEQLELLSDIRNFVAFEGVKINVASTQEIINRFRDRLPEGTSPLFRALLLEICEFHRDSSGHGIWTLRQDFRW